MKTSLIISTYNWAPALRLVLKSVKTQSVLPDEVLIADDGSTDETRQLITEFQRDFPVPLFHIWHEDQGFRASEIRNKAIKHSQYEYIIQIDGDMVLHKDFIKDHKQLAEKGCFISGSRVLADKALTERKIALQDEKFSPFSKGITNFFNALHFPIINRFITPKNTPIETLIYKIRGCNMSFWREDLMDIGGYDESFVGWGREDSELVLRLLKKGLFLKRIKMAGVQYHLHHKENDRYNFEKNHQIMMQSFDRQGYQSLKSSLL